MNKSAPLMIGVEILPFVWAVSLFGKNRRGIHDLVAKTVIVEI
jgi:uncharacterized RDD family membrane protein YckC